MLLEMGEERKDNFLVLGEAKELKVQILDLC